MRLLALFVLALGFHALGFSADIRIAYEDDPEWPWTTAKLDGLDQILAIKAAEAAGMKAVLICLPRKRAFEQLKAGELDGILNLSFKPERLEFLAYPLAGEKADPERRLHHDTNSVFIPTGDPLQWDGKAFQGLTGVLGALPGHGSADSLRKLGLKVDDGAKSVQGQLDKVAKCRLQGAILPTDAAKQLLSKDPALAKAVTILATPYTAKAAYLCLSKPYATADPARAERLWAEVAKVRESAEYKATTSAMLLKDE